MSVIYFSGPNTSLYERARSKTNGKRKVRNCVIIDFYYLRTKITTFFARTALKAISNMLNASKSPLEDTSVFHYREEHYYAFDILLQYYIKNYLRIVSHCLISAG